MTAEEIQQAREHARRAVDNPFSTWSRDKHELLARAVLALTEQQPTDRLVLEEQVRKQGELIAELTEQRAAIDESFGGMQIISDGTPQGKIQALVETIEHLWDEQPEPAAPPLDEDPVAVALGLAEPKNADIAARAQALAKRVAILRLEKELRGQPEPVSEDNLAAHIWGVRDAHDVARDLLSRYDIYLKPQGGTDV